MTELEKMLAGKLYDPTDETIEPINYWQVLGTGLFALLAGDAGGGFTGGGGKACLGENAFFQGPIQFDYGVFTSFGKNFYVNACIKFFLILFLSRKRMYALPLEQLSYTFEPINYWQVLGTGLLAVGDCSCPPQQ